MINLKLAQAVEATHYIDNVLYKFVAGELYRHSHSGIFDPAEDADEQLVKLQRIDFTEPEVVTEYVKVTDSIFDLRESLEGGELHYEYDGDYIPIVTPSVLCAKWNAGPIYRKVEKLANWKEVAREFVSKSEHLELSDTLGEIIDYDSYDPEREEFIEFIKQICPLVK